LASPCAVHESITISSDIINQALAKGWSYITYSRTFTQTIGVTDHEDTASSYLVILGRGGVFNISRIGLRFNDYARTKVIAANKPLKVMADISYTGAGPLQARWEIATPPSTSGSPFYRNLKTVRQNLLGGGHKILASPPLPTEVPGKYLVRLNISAPDLQFSTPVIRYNVSGKAKRERKKPVPQLTSNIKIYGPENGASLNKGSKLEWQALNDRTVAYRLEIFAHGKQPLPHPGQITHSKNYRELVTGIIVKSSMNKTKLSAAVRSYLSTGKTYEWRVVALDEDGKQVGVSPVNLFNIE
jgi:hypothetical protein